MLQQMAEDIEFSVMNASALGSKFETLGHFLGDELEEAYVSGALAVVSYVGPSLERRDNILFNNGALGYLTIFRG